MGIRWEEVAADLLRFAGVRRGDVPMVYDVAARLFGTGCVRLMPPEQMHGSRSFNVEWFDGRRQIWVDREQPEARIRFLVAREIAAIQIAGVETGLHPRDAADRLGASIALPWSTVSAALAAVGPDCAAISRRVGLRGSLVATRAAAAQEVPLLVVTDHAAYTVGDPTPWPTDVRARRLVALRPTAGHRVVAHTAAPWRMILAAG
jgi:hypothetical protein